MKITRLEDGVERSIIRSGNTELHVKELPPILREKVIKLLKKLRGVKRIEVGDELAGNTVEWADKITSISFLRPNIRTEFRATLQLLRWYVFPHWRGTPGRIGADIYCSDCGYPERPGRTKYCGMPGCPSHKKWRAVLGPSYKPPDKEYFLRKFGIRKVNTARDSPATT